MLRLVGAVRVDAALDEANNNRFGRLVLESAEKSHFIITYQKLSVGIADQMYGVTMQRPAVNTQVSVRFQPSERIEATAAAWGARRRCSSGRRVCWKGRARLPGPPVIRTLRHPIMTPADLVRRPGAARGSVQDGLEEWPSGLRRRS